MLVRRAKNWLQFKVEMFILRGPFYRMLSVIGLIGLISAFAGGLMFAASGDFTSPGDAVWWAFLRLTDPGYLGDDEGTLRRIVSTLITVLGYVVFLGALVAIMTQWFQQTMTRLQEGLTPLVQRQHILVIGWTNRSPIIIRELFHSEGRAPNFLRRIGAKRLSVVLLSAEEPDVVMRHLRSYVGMFWQPARFILRYGDPAHLDKTLLQRVDFLNAATIILPADRSPSAFDTVDGSTVKNLITIADIAAAEGRPPPPVVAEVLDFNKASLARTAYSGGPLQVIASDELVSRLLVQNICNPGLSHIYTEVLGYGHGNELYVRTCQELAGKRFVELAAWFPAAIPLGIIRRRGDNFDALLAPVNDELRADDRLVLLAEDYESSEPSKDPTRAFRWEESVTTVDPVHADVTRVLVIGWNHKAPALLDELGEHTRRFEIDILSRVPIDERRSALERYGFAAGGVTLRHHQADFTSSAALQQFDVQSYQTAVILASDWKETDASTDSRTILGYLVLRERLTGVEKPPNIIVELLNPDNRSLFDNKPCEVIVSPVLASHVLTQVALRHELLCVFEELFAHDGADISFVPAADYLGERQATFDELRAACSVAGQIVIGLRLRDDVQLNPPGDIPVEPAKHEAIVLIPRWLVGRNAPGG